VAAYGKLLEDDRRPTMTMTIDIELKPDEERALLERARWSGRDPAQHVRQLIRDDIQAISRSIRRDEASPEEATTLDTLIDHEFVADCEREIEGKDIPAIEEVRQMLSKISGSLAQEIIAEREDRF
jgi:hypothetical protein